MFTKGYFVPRKDVFLKLILKLLFHNDLHYTRKKLPQPVLAELQVALVTKLGANETRKIYFSPQFYFLRNSEMGPDSEHMNKCHRK